MIYFVRSVETGNIKIGCTGDVKKRIAQLTSEHGKLQLLGVLVGGRAFENALHRAFAEYRVEELGREWFKDNGSLRHYIDLYAGRSEDTKPRRPHPLRKPIYHEAGINCRLYDLMMKKRQQSGFEDYDVYALAKDTGIPFLTLDRMVQNQVRVIKDAHFEAVLKFFKCEVNEFLQYVPE